MSVIPAQTSNSPHLVDDAVLRANTYSLLATLLRDPPDRNLLAVLLRIETSADAETELECGWHNLKLAATDARIEDLDDEFHALFIGLGHGEVIPYGSWYQTGYLMDKPLASLRQSLAELGLARRDETREPEDHIAAVCECMAILIDDHSELSTQREFYRAHMHGWLGACFRDIEKAPSSRFYRSVATLGLQFVALEEQYLDINDT